jgi:hypothetical protein
MKSYLTGAKDKFMSVLGKILLTRWGLHKYGTIQSLRLQSEIKHIDATLVLKGESGPIELRISYKIEKIENQSFFVADQIAFSREWANMLFNDHCPPEARRIEIHAAFAALL